MSELRLTSPNRPEPPRPPTWWDVLRALCRPHWVDLAPKEKP